MAAAAGGSWMAWEWGTESFRTMARAAAVLVLLNLLDGLFTLIYLQLDLASEANPLMRVAYQASPVCFMLAKLGLVSCALAILCAHHRLASARLAITAGAVMYAGIVAYHLSFLARLVG